MLGDLKGNDEISLADAQNRTANLQRIGYLHDGRARTIDEAIRWYGGEALESKNAYEALSEGQKSAVIDFLESYKRLKLWTFAVYTVKVPITLLRMHLEA